MPVSLQAETFCDDLWFTRNLVFDRAGYCFGSPLGQAVFGTDNCSTGSLRLTPADKQLVDRVKAKEAEFQCQTDTKRRRVEIEMLSLRKALQDLPVLTGYESACIGWVGEEIALRSGHSDTAPQIGRVARGDTLLTSHELGPDAAWEFLQVQRDNQTISMGWAKLTSDQWNCEQYAG